MLVNLLATSNQGSYNISVARMFGLTSAIYIDALINITEKATRKNKLVDGFIQVDRDYITSITTLSLEEQIEIDKRLIQVGILEKNEAGNLNLKILELSNIIVSDEEILSKDIENIMKRVHKATKASKETAIAEKLKTHISTQNPELRAAYGYWIDAVISKEGWMSTAAVLAGESCVDAVSNRDLDVALGIIQTAAINGYRDMQWAVERFKQSYRPPVIINSELEENKIAEVF